MWSQSESNCIQAKRRDEATLTEMRNELKHLREENAYLKQSSSEAQRVVAAIRAEMAELSAIVDRKAAKSP